MSRALSLTLAAVAAAATGVLVWFSVPDAPDPNEAAAAVVTAYTEAPNPAGAPAVAAEALPSGGAGVLVVAVVDAVPGQPQVRVGKLTVTGVPPSPALLAQLSQTGTLGVVGVDEVTAYVAVPSSGSPLVPALLALLGALVAAGLVAAGRATTSVQQPAPVPADPAANRAAAERATLVAALADLAPRLPGGLSEQAIGALADVGVEARSVDGQPFDPAAHTAVGSEPAPLPELTRHVARTERPQFADRGRPVTRPLVVVYTEPEPTAAAEQEPAR